MSQLRNDGEYIIYIIQFKYVKDKDESWHNAGSCDQFITKGLSRKQWENIVFKLPFKDIHAGGECWQKTGINGTYNFNHASNVMLKIAKWNPGREFRVAQLNIKQKTTQISIVKF